MGALVLEGGTFRPIFSCGVMDALLECDVHFPYVIGVSAGITDGVSYVSKQIGRNREVLRRFRHDKRYVGAGNFLKEKSLFGLKFAYETIPTELIPFDWDAYLTNPAEVRVGVTNAATGKAEYLDGKKMDRQCTMLKATCALPLLFPAIEIEGQKYYDGGVCDPIPVRKAQADGHEKMLIVLTRPESYRKKPSKSNQFAAKVLKKKYPKMVEPLLTRHEYYNREVAYCNQLEQQGRAVVLRPSEEVQIESFEKDMDKIERCYRYGYNLAMQRMEEIRQLLV